MFSNKKPGPVTPLLTLKYPFDYATWTMFYVSCVYVYLAILLFKIVLNGRVTGFQALSLSLSPVLRQSSLRTGGELWNHWYSKTVLNVWFLCGILLSYAYTCNLLANLISAESEKPVNTFQDILDQSHMLTVLDGNSLVPFMANSKNKVIQEVYKVWHSCSSFYFSSSSLFFKVAVLEQGGIFHNRQFSDYQLKRLNDGTASRLLPKDLIYGTRHVEKLGTEVLFSRHTSYTFKRGHPLKPEIERVILGLHEGGVTLHFINKLDRALAVDPPEWRFFLLTFLLFQTPGHHGQAGEGLLQKHAGGKEGRKAEPVTPLNTLAHLRCLHGFDRHDRAC